MVVFLIFILILLSLNIKQIQLGNFIASAVGPVTVPPDILLRQLLIRK